MKILQEIRGIITEYNELQKTQLRIQEFDSQLKKLQKELEQYKIWFESGKKVLLAHQELLIKHISDPAKRLEHADLVIKFLEMTKTTPPEIQDGIMSIMEREYICPYCLAGWARAGKHDCCYMEHLNKKMEAKKKRKKKIKK